MLSRIERDKIFVPDLDRYTTTTIPINIKIVAKKKHFILFAIVNYR